MTPFADLDIVTAILCVVVAAIVTAVLIVLLRPLLLRYALAIPNRRSSHRTPTPQGGGIAVIAATIAVGGIAALWLGVATPLLAILLVVVTALAVLGAIDDIRPLGPALRFGLQGLAMLILAIAMPADWRALPALPLVFERTLLVIAGLWFVNLVNFMDGLDWITVAEVVPVAGTLAALGLSDLYPVHTTRRALAVRCDARLRAVQPTGGAAVSRRCRQSSDRLAAWRPALRVGDAGILRRRADPADVLCDGCDPHLAPSASCAANVCGRRTASISISKRSTGG